MFRHCWRQLRKTLARPARDRQTVATRRAVRPRVEALEGRALPSANLWATDVYLTDVNGTKLTKAAEGSRVYAQATFRTQDLPANAKYVIQFTLDGVTRTTDPITWGAGAAGVGYWISPYWGDWVVKPGAHTLKVELDATNAVAESSGADNVKSVQFTPVTFSDAYANQTKFVTPLAGTPFVNWTIINYVDLDSSPGKANTLDYMGGHRTYDGHNGLDMTLTGFQTDQRFVSMDVGVPIYAAADGVVVEAHDSEYDRNTDWTHPAINWITIDHGNGWQTIYYHLRKDAAAVSVGDYVKAGQMIALAGSSGDSSDPHLHFEVHYQGMVVETYVDGNAYWYNPLPYAPTQDATPMTFYSQHHITENGGSAAVTIPSPSLFGGVYKYTTQDITAKAGSDYTAKSGLLSFLPFDSAKTVSIPIIDDGHHEGAETFRVILSDLSNTQVWSQTWTIIDNDALLNFDDATGTLTVNSDTGKVGEVVTLDEVGASIKVTVNNEVCYFPAAKVKAIKVNGSPDADVINVYATPAGVPTTVDAGGGSDVINVGMPGQLFGDSLGPIQGDVTVAGGFGNNTLHVKDDTVLQGGHSYTLNGTTLSRAGAGKISFSQVQIVDVTAGDGNDTFTLASLPPAVQFKFKGGGGSDTLVGPNQANTWVIDGADKGFLAFGWFEFESVENLTGGSSDDKFEFKPGGSLSGNLKGGAGTDTLDDSALAGPVVLNLATGKATKIGGTFSGIEAASGSQSAADKLIGPNGPNTWKITGNNAEDVNGTFTASSFEALAGGPAADTFVFSAGKGVSGPIDGGGGSDTLDYLAYVSPVTVNLQTKAATGTGGFAHVEKFVGGGQADTLVGPAQANVWHVMANNGGDLNGQVVFGSFENLTGNVLSDTFSFADGVGVSGKIDGGAGIDRLDYSAYTTGVKVDLSAGLATGVAGGIAGIEDVTGGSGKDVLVGDGGDNLLDGGADDDVLSGLGGNDILLGGAGHDKLFGGDGRDIVFGGQGQDQLSGDPGDDVLIGGSTTYDANYDLLRLFLAQWKRTDLTYAQRINQLQNVGVFMGQTYKLNAAVVLDDNAVDHLMGGAGQDWFWAGLVSPGKDQTDAVAGEKVN